MALTQISTQGIKDGTITGTDLATNIDLVDNQKLRLGNSQDLQIFHDPQFGHSFIKESGSGGLIFGASIYEFYNAAISEKMLTATENGAVELYHDNVKMLETTAIGVTLSGDLKIPDGEELRLGNGNDLQIYHDGTNSFIDSSTNDLFIRSNGDDLILRSSDDIFLQPAGGGENGITVVGNGTVELYYDNSKKFETTSAGVQITGNALFPDSGVVQLGASQDLRLYHDGTNSIISNTTGTLFVLSNDLKITNLAANENMAKFIENGAVELYYDNSKKFETQSIGITVTGQVACDELDMADSTGAGNNRIKLGTGDDLQIYHDGSHSYALNTTGNFFLGSNSSVDIGDGDFTEYAARFIHDGRVELYYDNSKKFETSSTGGIFRGTNFTAVDNCKISFGTGDDLQIYHDGSNSAIVNTTGVLTLKNSGAGKLQLMTQGAQDVEIKTNNELSIKCLDDAAVELYYDATKKLETTANGTQFDGRINFTGTGQKIDLIDNQEIRLGTGDDLQIYHNGSHSYIVDGGTGELRLGSNSGIRLTKHDSETVAFFDPDGGVELYHDNTKMLETTSTGVTIVGEGDFTSHSLKIRNWGLIAAYKGLFHANHGTSTSEFILINNETHTRLGTGSGGNIQLEVGGNGEDAINCNHNGGVELYYDNSKKFDTTTYGVKVTGRLAATTSITGADNVQIKLGDSDDLKIYSDGTNGILEGGGSGGNAPLFLNANTIRLQTQSGGEMYIDCQENGAVELFHNDSKKFETQSTGAKVTGTLDVTGAIYTFNEFNMVDQGNKFIDTAHKDHYLYFRRINDGDAGHSVHCYVTSGGVWNADFNDTSDEKLKENITTISDGAINSVKQLRPVNFDWKETDKANNVSGFIAQEIKTVLPNLVYGTEYDPTIVDEKSQRIKSVGYSVNTIGLVAHLTKALQEAITKIEVLETEVASLKAS